MITFHTLGRGSVEELRRALAGDVVVPGDPDYETARRVWNGAIDRRPALIARCAGVPDVVEAVRFARSERLAIAVRGGAHNVAGHGTCDGGLVIDLSPMRGVEIDPEARIARVQGGARWADLDAAAQAHGLATTGGLISSTGVGGLTLGGGIGWLARKHGLACDNLLAADVVTADGTLVTADSDAHAELFWALRGGGGNFGVVTEFTFRLHPVGTVLAGLLAFELADAGRFLRGLRDRALPDELTLMGSLMTAPPTAPFPEPLQGRRILAATVCYAGDAAGGERVLEPLRRLAPVAFEHVGEMPYAVAQQLLDAGAPAGLGNRWTSAYLSALDDDVIDVMVARAADAPGPLSQVHLYQLGGAIARTATDATAYTHRGAPYLLSFLGLWADPAHDHAAQERWARAARAQIDAHAAGAYVNFADGETGAEEVYPRHHGRLAAVKAQWDPSNLFRVNHNIAPAA
jgi:FAD/FMN-containing dehydrogenase